MILFGPKPGSQGGAVVHISGFASAHFDFQWRPGRRILIWALVLLTLTAVASHGQEKPSKIPFSISATKKKPPSGTGAGPAWRVIQSRYTEIRYTSFKALKQFERDVDYSKDGLGLGFFSSSKDPEATVKKKMDALYARVAEILDMRRGMKKVVIEVYDGKKALHQAYGRIVGGVCRVRAWYLFARNTIYINADDVHEGMLAHEMAHAIIDHYFNVRPPRASAEILARYVDAHLYKKTKKY
ncbi:MAG: hypothetical protein GY859_19030 [Desulfobacterales bacterium]|nr:hypothetical protein [Desulfobacterales bacterium]